LTLAWVNVATVAPDEESFTTTPLAVCENV
jgi:hypothetical protein